MKVALAIWSMLLLLAFGCVPMSDVADDAHEVQVDTIGQTIVVRNGLTGLWGEDGWRLEERSRLGVSEGVGVESFGMIHAVSFDPQGNTVVLDGQAAEIRVFTDGGEFVRAFGSEGQGPGELAGPSGLAWDDQDRIWIPEYGNGRYSVFDSTGQFVSVIGRQVRPWSDRQLWAYSGRGRFADELGLLPKNGRQMKGFARVDTAGEVLDSVLFVGEEITSDVRRLARFPRDLSPYATEPVFSVPQDDLIWFAMSDEYRLYQLGPEGDTVRISEVRHRKQELSQDEQGLIEQKLAEGGLDPEDYPLDRQVIRGLHLLESGHLLVQIEEEVSGVGEEKWGNVFDAFDPEGRFLGTIRSNFTIDGAITPASRGRELLFATRDTLGIGYVVRAEIVEER